MTDSIKIDPSCSDDCIQAHLLKCMFILRYRQNSTKLKYPDPVANDTKWEVFWGAVSRYSSSIVRNEDEEYNDFLTTNYSLLYKNENLKDWGNDKTCSRRNKSEVSSISASKWVPLHCCIFNFTGSVEYSKVLSLECKQSQENKKAVNNIESPLHLAVTANNTNMKILKNLLKYFSSMTSTESDKGEIPLHYAARNSNNVEVVELLIEAYPQGLEKKCSAGEVPLFKACTRPESNLQIVQKLFQTSPKSIESINKNGETPLHASVHKLETSSLKYQSILVDIIKTLLTSYPDSMTIQDINNGNTPLHMLCSNNILNNEDFHTIFEQMLKLCPAAASLLNKKQQTPLHLLLCGTNAHQKDLNTLVPMLLDVYSKAVAVMDTYRCYPIHYAVMHALNLTLIERIINGHTDALLKRGDLKMRTTMTPIQFSLIRHKDDDKYTDKLTLVKYLYSKCPESITIRSGKNETLLDIAVEFCNDSNKNELVKAVYHMDPSAAMIVNHFGDTPLCEAIQMALENQNSPSFNLDQVRFLSHICPASVTLKNRRGVSPLQEISKTHGNKDRDMIYRLLLLAVPDVNPKELCRMNYMARRMAMFVFYTAIFREKRYVNVRNNRTVVSLDNEFISSEIFIRLRNFDSLIVRRIILLL